MLSVENLSRDMATKAVYEFNRLANVVYMPYFTNIFNNKNNN